MSYIQNRHRTFSPWISSTKLQDGVYKPRLK